MIKSLTETKIAVLVANGFDEQNFLSVQKVMQEMGATLRIISSNQGLVNGWDVDAGAWGHNYAVDAPLNTALGVDYDALIIPGGQRSVEKLKMTAHTRRFIGSFMAAEKPVAVMGDAVLLMAYAEQIVDRNVSGNEEARDIVEQSGARWSDAAVQMDQNMMSGLCDEASQEEYFTMMRALFAQIQDQDMDQAA